MKRLRDITEAWQPVVSTSQRGWKQSNQNSYKMDEPKYKDFKNLYKKPAKQMSKKTKDKKNG